MHSDKERAHITFSYDDGRRNNYNIALPLHEKYGVKASFAIIAERAINPSHWERHMTPYEISDASARGVEIMSHGFEHREKFTNLSPADLHHELGKSQEVLNGFISGEKQVKTLCLPFSAFNEQVLREAKEYYSIVRGIGRGMNDIYSDETYVSSYALLNDSSFDQIKERIDMAVRQHQWLILMLHGVVNGEVAPGRYDITAALLQQVLHYVQEIGSEKLKPVFFKEVIQTRQELAQRKSRALVKTEPGAYTLADEHGYMVTYHKNEEPNNTVVISFGGLPSKKTPMGFGSAFLLAQGYDHIFVAQEARSQYQKLSLEEFTRIVQPHLGGKNVFTYGSSLGAYAALYYGGAIDAGIIAAAPKNSAHPSMRKKRFSHVEFMHKELKDTPLSSRTPLILFDPFREEEAKFIEKWVLPAYPEANLLKLPYAGHTVLNTMKESGVLKDFMKMYIEKDEVLPFKLREDDSYIWHAEKAREQLKLKNYTEAKSHYETSLKLKRNSDAVAGLIKILVREDALEAATAMLMEHKEHTGTFRGIPVSIIRTLEDRTQTTILEDA